MEIEKIIKMPSVTDADLKEIDRQWQQVRDAIDQMKVNDPFRRTLRHPKPAQWRDEGPDPEWRDHDGYPRDLTEAEEASAELPLYPL